MDLLADSDPSLTKLQLHKIHEERLKDKVYVLENVTKPVRPVEKRRPKRMSNGERRRIGLYKLKDMAYTDLLPLNELWKAYIDDLLTGTASTWAQKLTKADYHGMQVSIAKAKNPTLIGMTGIVAIETENVFKIVTSENKTKVIPKENTVFTVPIKGTAFTIYGDQCRFRAADRSSKKFKPKPSVDL